MQLQLKISNWFVLTEKQNIVEMLNSVISFGNIPELFVFPNETVYDYMNKVKTSP